MTYSALISVVEPGHRGRRSLHAIDRAPMTPMELADYFASIPADELAACWVACMSDMANFWRLTCGDLARPLLVVAERLTVKPDAVVVARPKVSRNPRIGPDGLRLCFRCKARLKPDRFAPKATYCRPCSNEYRRELMRRRRAEKRR